MMQTKVSYGTIWRSLWKECNRAPVASVPFIRNSSTLTHVNEKGSPCMVDISEKQVTSRIAKAQANVLLPKEVTEKLRRVESDVMSKKGPVFATAIIAGVMASKKTSELIPFCHPIPLDSCNIEVQLKDNHSNELYPELVHILATVKTTNKTGVEMEALTAANIAALTVYDMLKALSHKIVISNVMLLEKEGGKSGVFRHSVPADNEKTV